MVSGSGSGARQTACPEPRTGGEGNFWTPVNTLDAAGGDLVIASIAIGRLRVRKRPEYHWSQRAPARNRPGCRCGAAKGYKLTQRLSQPPRTGHVRKQITPPRPRKPMPDRYQGVL